MKYRRYYPKGSKRKYVNSQEEFEQMVETYGFEAAVELDNAEIELKPETDEEHRELLFVSCERVLNNTRFYLDHLDIVPTFKVNIKKTFPTIKR